MTEQEYIKIHKKYPDPYDNSEWHTHYEGEEEDYKKIVEYNKALCEEFPFLIPSNRWSGIKITEAQNGGYWPGSPDDIPDYDYTYTELDDMPTGWRLAFGLDMCREIKEELIKFDYLDKYRITQIKEKYGSLRWYCGGYPSGSKIDEIISKYERLSYDICIGCGKPAKWVSTGWISPWCDDCKNKYNDDRYVPVEDYYKED